MNRTSMVHTAKESALIAAKAALDKKAENVKIYDMEGTSPYTDYVVLASGSSERQVSAISESIVKTMKESGIKPLGIEGLETSKWVLCDFGDVVVHLFHPESRAYFNLDGLLQPSPQLQIPEEFYANPEAVLS